MIDNLIDVIASLTLIMREETDQLKAHCKNGSLAELAAAKLRLVGVLESELASTQCATPAPAMAPGSPSFAGCPYRKKGDGTQPAAA